MALRNPGERNKDEREVFYGVADTHPAHSAENRPV